MAREIVERSGLLALLGERVDSPVGRPRSLSIEGFLVAAQINGLRRGHRATIAEIARVLNSLLPWQLRALQIKKWNPIEAYDRTDRLFNLIARALNTPWEATVRGNATTIDAQWILNRLTDASIIEEAKASASLAVDGTDLETWASLHADPTTIENDGTDELTDAQGDGRTVPRRPAGKRRGTRAKVLGIGPDGRKIYTKDPDARAGHRTATNSRAAGEYIGFEGHLAVQTRDVAWTNGVDKIRLGPEVPALIRNVTLVPAGTHRGKAIIPTLIAAKENGQEIKDVIYDRGYSLLLPETTSHPLNRAEIHQTFRPDRHQRGPRPFTSSSVLLDGQIFAAYVPADLKGPLPLPRIGATSEEIEQTEAAFNRRARFRYSRHAPPDRDGATRWICPVHVGFLRSRSHPSSMRRPRKAPLVDIPGDQCCEGTITVQAEELPYWQQTCPGTTAWRVSMGRRQAAEAANSGLKGGFVDIGRKFFRVLGLVKVALLLGFTIAGYNVDRYRSFVSKTQPQPDGRPTRTRRARRRKGTWQDVLQDRTGPSRDPPDQ